VVAAKRPVAVYEGLALAATGIGAGLGVAGGAAGDVAELSIMISYPAEPETAGQLMVAWVIFIPVVNTLAKVIAGQVSVVKEIVFHNE
jgi:hypothetical protein